MFDPAALSAAKAEKTKKKILLDSITEKCYLLIPQDLQEGLIINVKEMACGDPSCSPIDTIFNFTFPNGSGMYSIPMAVDEIEEDDWLEFFPDENTLR